LEGEETLTKRRKFGDEQPEEPLAPHEPEGSEEDIMVPDEPLVSDEGLVEDENLCPEASLRPDEPAKSDESVGPNIALVLEEPEEPLAPHEPQGSEVDIMVLDEPLLSLEGLVQDKNLWPEASDNTEAPVTPRRPRMRDLENLFGKLSFSTFRSFDYPRDE
jgi:hypothetical protein